MNNIACSTPLYGEFSVNIQMLIFGKYENEIPEFEKYCMIVNLKTLSVKDYQQQHLAMNEI